MSDDLGIDFPEDSEDSEEPELFVKPEEIPAGPSQVTHVPLPEYLKGKTCDVCGTLLDIYGRGKNRKDMFSSAVVSTHQQYGLKATTLLCSECVKEGRDLPVKFTRPSHGKVAKPAARKSKPLPKSKPKKGKTRGRPKTSNRPRGSRKGVLSKLKLPASIDEGLSLG